MSTGTWVALFMIGYLLVGIGSARIAFTRILGDEPRSRQYKRHGDTWTDTSLAYDKARWVAALSIPFWFVVGIAGYITHTTPREKLAEREKRAKEMEEEVKNLAEKHGLKLLEREK